MTNPEASARVDELLQRYREAGANTSVARRNYQAAAREFERGQGPVTWAEQDEAYNAWQVTRRTENAAADAYYEAAMAAENGEIELVHMAGPAPQVLEIGIAEEIAGDEQLAAGERVGYLQKAGLAILFLAVLVTLACLFAFRVIPTKKSHAGGSAEENPGGQGPDTGGAFGVSERCFRYSDQLLTVDSTPEWTSGAAAHFGSLVASLQAALQQIAEVDQGVHETVQIQAKQVHRGKETLGNVVNGLMAAMSIAEALYGAGPAGPVISHQFQLAAASSAVTTDTDTTNGMHENAQRNAERLEELAQSYHELRCSL